MFYHAILLKNKSHYLSILNFCHLIHLKSLHQLLTPCAIHNPWLTFFLTTKWELRIFLCMQS